MATFLTHLHSDHVVWLADLWLTGWLPATFGGRTTPFAIHGPAGTRAMMSSREQAHQVDIQSRMATLGSIGVTIEATDVTEGVVMNADGIPVTALDVVHRPLALGYRVDYRGRSLIISGDTGISTPT